MAPTRAEAKDAFDTFIEAYDAKYPKAVECLTKDREELLTDVVVGVRLEDGVRSTTQQAQIQDAA